MDIGRPVVFAHGGVGNLPDHEDLMVLFAIMPLLLVGTIVIAAALNKRGILGANDRTIPVIAIGAAVAATLSTGAAAIHFAVAPAHLEEFQPFGMAFVAIGWFQVTWAQVYLLRPNQLVASVGGLGSAVIVAVWLLSRTLGLPFGPTPWVPEVPGTLDVVATAFEVALIGVVLPVVLPRRWPAYARERMPMERAFVLATFCVLAVTLFTVFALVGVPGAEASNQP